MGEQGKGSSFGSELLKAALALTIVDGAAYLGFNYLVRSRSGGMATGPSLSLAVFRVAAHRGDDSCSRLLNYCAHVSCTVANVGAGSGTALVQMELMQGNGAPLVHTEQVFINPGESRTVTHNFFEARLFGRIQYDCRVSN